MSAKLNKQKSRNGLMEVRMNFVIIGLMMIFTAFITVAPAVTMTYDLTDTTQSWYTPLYNPANPAGSDATPTFKDALTNAAAYLTNNPGNSALILFGSGTYEFYFSPTNYGQINTRTALSFSNINPPSNSGHPGHLTIKGLGTGVPNWGSTNPTVLAFSQSTYATNLTTTAGGTAFADAIEFHGTNCTHITFNNFHVERLITANDGSSRGTTQGTIITEGTSSSNGGGKYVQVTIPSGFPTPPVLFAPSLGQIIRAYNYTSGVPYLAGDTNTNPQIDFQSATNISGTTWELDGLSQAPTYATNQVIGIKMQHGSDSGLFINASDITYNHVRWTDCARTQFGTGTDVTDNITVTNCVTDRGDYLNGTTLCMATDSGGPQFHCPNATNIVVAGNTSTGEGDDAIALFGVAGASVTSNTVSDDFARGLFTMNCTNINNGASPEIYTTGNLFTNCFTIPNNLP